MSDEIMPERETLLAWMSAFLDGELPPEQERLLQQAMDNDPALLAHFEALCAAPPPEVPPLSAAEAARLTGRVMERATAGERGAADAQTEERLLWLASAACDGELSAEELAEATHLLTPARLPAFRALTATAEAAALALRAAESDPAAARAGAAALRAVEALRAHAEEPQQAAAPSAPETLFDAVSLGTAAKAGGETPRGRGRPWLPWRLLLPVAACVVAWLGVMSWQQIDTAPEGTAERAGGGDGAAATQAALALLPDEAPDADDAPWEVLGDNAADVQALEAGTHMAAVFATDDHQITVIWLAEPEPATSPETGT